ncbi:hypothetical protein HLG73_11895 [Lacticaseibacillus paracasei]|uniref:hypothetical protein n=1 Tax=Lacticaseibacillus paracasei TaxID=1597 RepID=UPI002358A8E0|nr:hypothetical protein [Lacticaseibacillus paracasei]WCZ20000.1 hypothetical protein HLG73_11895 [Lacticaseibacillus paracasei]
MSNETKREVFDDLVEELADAYIALDGEGIGDELTNADKKAYLKDYDAALPDDLPVIPEAVGKYIKTNRGHMSLTSGVENATCISEWLWGKGFDCGNDSVFARAWLLGVWRVEETGEVVRL